VTAIDPRGPWRRLHEHQERAQAHSLAILVWGPAPGDSLEARKRAEIRDALITAGHEARFSEDFSEEESVLDPLEEELLQADSADLIVVLYGERGVQSEVDTLLAVPDFASKAVIFIEQETYGRVLKSVSRGTWRKLQRLATEIREYTPEELERCSVVGDACEIAHRARMAAYVATVEARVRR
jgi:hypothetical protein